MLRLAGSMCWLASSDVTGDTSKRARVCGQPVRGVVSGFMIATSARHPSDQSRAAADAPGRGWTIHVLGKFTSWERDARSAIRSALEGSRRIVGMKRGCQLLSPCLLLRVYELLLPLRIACCAASRSARNRKNTKRRRSFKNRHIGFFAMSRKTFKGSPGKKGNGLKVVEVAPLLSIHAHQL